MRREFTDTVKEAIGERGEEIGYGQVTMITYAYLSLSQQYKAWKEDEAAQLVAKNDGTGFRDTLNEKQINDLGTFEFLTSHYFDYEGLTLKQAMKKVKEQRFSN